MINIEKAITDYIDRGIAVISPKRALMRQLYRERLTARAEMYAAAKSNRLTGAYTIGSANVNDIIKASSPALKAKVSQLIRDFPYLARAVNVIVDYSIGNGIIFQSRVWTRGAKPKLDKKTMQKIEDAVNWWMDQADASGKQHYYEMMRLSKRQDVEGGEFLLVKNYDKIPNKYIPYQLQMYEADWLATTKDNYSTGGIDIGAAPGVREIRQGIEYEKLTGRVTGYWFRDPNYGGKEIYISADQVVHGFDMLRPMQLRGVSAFAPGVLIANDLSTYLDTEIDGAKAAAKWVGVIETPDPVTRQAGLTTDSTTGKKIEELENAIIEYLRPGEKLELKSSNRPGTTFDPFVRLLLTMLSITTGAPYELISGDYRGLNMSTAQIVRNDFAQQLRPISVRHVRQYGMPTIKTAVDVAVLTGKLSLPGYWQNPRMYLGSEWQPPGMNAINPLREAKAQVEAISGLLKSPQEVALERGRNYEDVLDEIAQAKEMQKDRGLEVVDEKKNEKNNPAAVLNE